MESKPQKKFRDRKILEANTSNWRNEMSTVCMKILGGGCRSEIARSASWIVQSRSEMLFVSLVVFETSGRVFQDLAVHLRPLS